MNSKENQDVLFVWLKGIDETEDKYDLERELEVYLQFFTDWCYKEWRLFA